VPIIIFKVKSLYTKLEKQKTYVSTFALGPHQR